MTKKQFKKARRSLNATKLTRGVVWLRLFATFLAFIAFIAKYVWSAVSGAISGVDPAQVDDIFTKVFDIFNIEPVSFFSLKNYGAFGGEAWKEMLQGTGVKPEFVTWAAVIVGILLVSFFFKRVKKSKRNSSAFFMLFLLSAADLAANVLVGGIPAFNQENIMALVSLGVGVLTVLMTFNAMVKGGYLNKNFEQGMLLRKSELKRSYKASGAENVIEEE
jgi:hypothetical protein